MDQKDSWVVEVEKHFESETTPVEFHDDVIHRVPKSLLRGNNKEFYHPQVVSLGPYHFKKIEKLDDDEIELLKSQVVNKVHHEINGQSGTGLKSVLEGFKNKERKIKNSYARYFEYSGEVWAWMIARDACFVLEVLERFRRDEDTDSHHILNRKRHHPLLTDIVKDIFKMENQIPFWVLKEIRPDIERRFESALKNLSPVTIADRNNRSYKKISLLQLLHDYIVDASPSPSAPDDLDRSIQKNIGSTSAPDTLCRSSFRVFFSGIKWRWNIILINSIIIVFLSPFLLIMFIIFVIQEWRISSKWEIREHYPTVEELKKLGIKFKKLEGQDLGISHIKFKESNSTLYLPHIKVDDISEVILRNLFALEICCEDKNKPIIRYVILMNDLINTREDVDILMRANIITSNLGSHEEIALFWNSMLTSTEMPRNDPIDKALLDINQYRKKWWKVFWTQLWAQFLMTRCSEPWLFLSLLAGLLLLLLTITQVVCLFESCQIKSGVKSFGPSYEPGSS